MKMVKGLLFGSAAGLVAVAGAQAADLPVKAKPVEYVKVCSLYGAGFYYIPGTDICMKMGGYVRTQYYYNTGTTVASGLLFGPNNAQQSNLAGFANDTVLRTRAVWTVDTRSQTEWGTLRTYVLMGFNHDSPGGSSSTPAGTNAAALYATRGFIQFAGFTLGKAQSFYDILSTPAVSYFGIAASDTSDAGALLGAYTAQFGNGVSATISAEEPRRMAIVNTAINNAFTIGGPVSNDYDNVKWPDVVANLRVDQTWGSFQVMGAVHDASAAYNAINGNNCLATSGATITGSMLCGTGATAVGFAVGAGAVINTNFISQGDKFQFQVNYTEGALRYAIYGPAAPGSPALFGSNNSLGLGFLTDGIYPNNGSVELTKVLGVNATYDHLWTPALKTSLYGGYFNIDYNANATAAICASVSGGANTISNVSNCNPDFSFWYIGSRTQWNVRPDFYMGVDVLYHRLETSFAGTATYTALAGAARPTGTYKIEDQDAVSVTFRAHRDIVP